MNTPLPEGGDIDPLKIKRLGRFRGRDAFLEHRQGGAVRIHTPYFTLFVAPPKRPGQRHLAAVAAKRHGDSHLRHRIRRRIKAAFTTTVVRPCALICYAKPSVLDASFEQLQAAFSQINTLKEL